MFSVSPSAYGQDPLPPAERSDTVITLHADTLPPPPQAEQGDIETTIQYTARDSIRLDVINRIAYLYGDAKVTYGQITLTAEIIEINWNTHTVSARGAPDTLGIMRGTPVFRDGDEVYEAGEMQYNFQTRKGIISEVVTQQGEGYIHGETVKRTDEALFINDAHYTTCNLAHPHFYIRARRLKVIPDDKIVSGPFNLYVGDVPTPLGFLLGIFPVPKKQKSGIIFPIYGESADRGFFLRNGGYYWSVNDYLGIQFLGEIYSRGGWGMQALSNYIKRYSYSGNVDLKFNRRVSEGIGDAPRLIASDFWVNWNHQTISRRNSRFSAAVNAGTSTYNQFNNYNPTAYLSNVFNSNINYSKTFGRSPFSTSITLRHDQNVVTNVMNFTLPEWNVSMNRVYPFKRDFGTGARWYEKINMAYNFNSKALVSNTRPGIDTIPINLETVPTLFSRNYSQYGARHTIPLATTMKVFRHFNLNPNFTWNEYWYPQQLQYHWTGTHVETDTIRGFSRAFDYGGGTTLSTNIYGTFHFRSKRFQAVRHLIVPTFTYLYRPDFSNNPFTSFQQHVQVDPSGRLEDRSRYQGFIYGAPQRGKQNSLGFNVRSMLEAKVLSPRDTARTTRKINLLENIGLTGNYNFAAEEFKLSPVTFNVRTRLFERVDINYNSTWDPYAFRLVEAGQEPVVQTRVDEIMFFETDSLKKIKNYNLSMSTNLNPSTRKRELKSPRATQAELDFIRSNPEMYVDFTMPWSLFLSYNLSRIQQGHLDPFLAQSITFNGDIRITQKWKIGLNSGFDLVNKAMTPTQINIFRDLHCWEMRFNWIPFGIRQSYSFDINVKASVLQDLRLNRRRDWYDNSLRQLQR